MKKARICGNVFPNTMHLFLLIFNVTCSYSSGFDLPQSSDAITYRECTIHLWAMSDRCHRRWPLHERLQVQLHGRQRHGDPERLQHGRVHNPEDADLEVPSEHFCLAAREKGGICAGGGDTQDIQSTNFLCLSQLFHDTHWLFGVHLVVSRCNMAHRRNFMLGKCSIHRISKRTFRRTDVVPLWVRSRFRGNPQHLHDVVCQTMNRLHEANKDEFQNPSQPLLLLISMPSYPLPSKPTLAITFFLKKENQTWKYHGKNMEIS